jgi:MerR family transcriptional regulator, copper efflux regulator
MEARAMQTMTIGKAAREAGVNIETIRFYERRGLIERPPKGNGYRVYSPEEVARIRFIKEAQQIGFSLSEIGDLLSLRADPAADCSEVRHQAVAKAPLGDRFGVVEDGIHWSGTTDNTHD